MMNFTFHNPTRIHFGEGQISKISQEIPETSRVLVIYGGGSIKTNGVYDQVKEALSNHSWFEFSGIEPNPKYDTTIKSLEIIKEQKIDYLLAVGGGSVIDATKFIAAAALYDGDDPWDILKKQEKISQAIPMGAILTLPATGSESNSGSVMTRDGNKLFFGSPLVYPLFAILDPATTLTLSDRQISNGVVDAFVHTVEQYLTYPVNAKVQDRFSEGILQTLIADGPLALEDNFKNNLEVRGNIMWSATLALNGLIGAGVPQDWTTHMIGHELTGLYNIDHARTLAIVYPAVLKVCRQAKHDKLIQYGKRVWNLTNPDEEQLIDEAIAKTAEFFQKMQVPTSLSEVNLGASDIDKILNKLEQHGMVALGENSDTTLEVSRQILEAAL
ncbi:MAG: iron-containing alcohol dehydrogenase [Alcanivoracaceae bacterium]|nr:iron-containing alcohol dehydrogenase [Alcanivoracaceae bacterium]